MEWANVSIGDLAYFINGKAFKSEDWGKTGIPIIRIQNLNDKDAAHNYISKDAYVEDFYKIEKGDLLFAWSGTPGTSFGAHIWQGDSAYLNQHIFKLIPYNGVDKTYLFYALNYLVNNFVKAAKGTAGLSHITKKSLEETLCFIPVPNIQSQIVSKLDMIFSELDNAKNILIKSRSQLEDYKRIIFSQVFSKSNGNNSAFKNIKLLNYAESIQYGYTSKSSLDFDGTKYLRITDIQDENVNWDEVPRCKIEKSELDKYMLKIGDIVFARSGNTVGKTFLVEKLPYTSVYASYLIRIRSDQSFLNPKYLYYFFQSPQFWDEIKAGISGVGQPNFNGSKLSNMIIPVPSLDIQERLIDHLDYYLSLINKVDIVLQQNIDVFETLSYSILKRTFEGELSIENPCDDPIDDWLIRVKNEKALYIKQHKESRILNLRNKKMETDNRKTILEILEESDTPILSSEVWKKSIYYKDKIEDFYAELKEMADKISEYRTGKDSFLKLKK